MSDSSVHAALRSDASVVLVDAPAGCGKTHQGADLARDLASGSGSRLLILTHTHAACSVFADRTSDVRSKVTIRTIDSLVAEIAAAYHMALGLPADVQSWIRQRGETGYQELCEKVCGLMGRRVMIAEALATRHAMVVCDEHQDSSPNQHQVIMSLHAAGSSLRVFADPMQRIFKQTGSGSDMSAVWEDWKGRATHEALDYPHRWSAGSLELGRWALQARETLRTGGRLDLRGTLPSTVRVVRVDNLAQAHFDIRLSTGDRKPLDEFVRKHPSLLVLTRFNETAAKLRPFWNRSIPLWEGHTRPALDKLAGDLNAAKGDSKKVAEATVALLAEMGKGFSASGFGTAFLQEVETGCVKTRKGRPASIQRLARHLLEHPNHRGVAKVLRELWTRRDSDPAFSEMEIDSSREFWDAIRLGSYDSTDAGMAELASRRTYVRPQPPPKAISTIHKAKGLECGAVMVLPCDARNFPDKPDARCLLYVAISRASKELLLVVPRTGHSPLLHV